MKLFKRMKLFIWVDPYRVDYRHSMLIAVAETEEQARAIATSKAASWWAFGKFEQAPKGQFEVGKPTRVVDLPCAEWHEWEE